MSIPNASPQPQPQQPDMPPQYQQGAPNPYAQGGPQSPVDPVPLDQPYYGCPPVEAFLRFWKKYATFKGRASRSEFWWFMLANIIVAFVLGIIADNVDALSFLPTLWTLATFVPMLALATRRLHDTNKSGWWLFGYYAILSVLTIAFAVVMVFAIISFLEGSRGCPVSMYGAGSMRSFITLNGADPQIFANCIPSGTLTLLVIMFVVGFLVAAALSITYIVFMAMGPKPEGARFDDRAAQSQMAAPLYGAPSYGAPTYGAPSYGAPAYDAPAYGQPANQAPVYATPNAQASPAMPGTMNAPMYQQTPMAPAPAAQPMQPMQPAQPAPVSPETPAYQVPTIPAMPPMAQPGSAYGQDAAQTDRTAQPPLGTGNAFDPADAGQIPFDTENQHPFDMDAQAEQAHDPAPEQGEAHDDTADASADENAHR